MNRSRKATPVELAKYREATEPHYARLRALGQGWTDKHQAESEAISQVLRSMNAFLAHAGLHINLS